ncbi:hypothetical protein [Kocuria marina]|uniref:hypothetical protein n=1 Tax=Kocuria marina TaxID=223184 RepID=UPI0034607B09
MLGTSLGTAAVVCGAVSATMMIDCLLADRVVEWLGSETVLRYGASRPAPGEQRDGQYGQGRSSPRSRGAWLSGFLPELPWTG